MQAALTAYISLCVELPVISGKKNILASENHRKCVYVSRKVQPCWISGVSKSNISFTVYALVMVMVKVQVMVMGIDVYG